MIPLPPPTPPGGAALKHEVSVPNQLELSTAQPVVSHAAESSTRSSRLSCISESAREAREDRSAVSSSMNILCERRDPAGQFLSRATC
jgi:hypothetical protein